MADFKRDPRINDSLRVRRNVFGQVNNARFHRFPVGQISRNSKITILIGVNFRNRILKNLPRCVVFWKKTKNILQNVNFLRLQTAITTQLLQIAGNSMPNDPSTGCLVSIFSVSINSKSFFWATFRTRKVPNQIFGNVRCPILGKALRRYAVSLTDMEEKQTELETENHQ